MDIVLYFAPNTCALVSYITLTEANAPFEVRPLNFRKHQQRTPDFLKVNPKHKVPVLVVDGRPLTENVAINLWIARHFPAAKLFPGEPWQELQAISFMSWCAAGIHPFLSRINSPPRVCDLPNSEASVKKLAQEALHENFQIAEDALNGREFFFDHFTAADAHFFWCLRRGLQLDVDLSGFPKCMAHAERMKQRASVQKAQAYEKSVLEKFAAAA
jgi:glutathione S-transferase